MGYKNVPMHVYLLQVRVENIKDPADHIPAVLERVRPEYLTKTYQVHHVCTCVDTHGILQNLIGVRERANLVVSTGQFFYMYVTGTVCTYRNVLREF